MDISKLSHDHVSKSFNKTFSPVNCSILRAFSNYCLVIVVMSILFNFIICLIFCYRKRYLKPTNHFRFTFTSLNLVGSLIELPIMIISNRNCRWVFSDDMCKFKAFSLVFLGASSIYLLAAISYESFHDLNNLQFLNQQNSQSIRITSQKKLMVIFLCITYALFWAIMPLSGWNKYSLEKTKTTCVIEWNENSLGTKSYNLSVLLFVYLVPLLFIIVYNIKIINLVRNYTRFVVNFFTEQNPLTNRLISEQRFVTIRTLFIAGFFFISWTPYGIIFLISVFFDPSIVTPEMNILAFFFKESFFIWTPMIYIIFDERVRDIFCICFRIEIVYDYSNTVPQYTPYGDNLNTSARERLPIATPQN